MNDTNADFPQPDDTAVLPVEGTATGIHARSPFRRRTTLALSSALLVGGLVAGAGAGIAWSHSGGASTPTATAGPSTTAQQVPGQSGYGGFGAYGNQGGLGPGAGTLPQLGTPDTSDGSGQAGQETTSEATAAQTAGLVEITSTLTNGKGAGTGIVLSADGLVVTNHHVVAGATSVEVTVVATGKTYTARYVGGDATKDVAVLRLQDASDLTVADLSGTAAAQGDEITSVGDAGGDGGSLTAAPGTVSGLDQDITVDDEVGTSSRLTGLIQMAAYVVPGDSGGAVLDEDGEVVGMNVAASTGSGQVTGYAIPIATVTSVVDQVLAGSDTDEIDLGYHGFLGIALASGTAPTVASVEADGAAAEAGVTAGDTITAVDGTSVTTITQLRALVATLEPGEVVTLRWKDADGTAHRGTGTLGEAPIA